MPDWRSELDHLLTQLDDPDELAGEPHDIRRRATTDETASTDTADTSLPWELGALAAEDIPPDGDEVVAVRREIESTIRRLAALARDGEVEPVLRDDVIFVLQALTRPHPPEWTWAATESDVEDDEHNEWHLASAAAILRFCRIVQRLTNALTDELD
ncbi:MAG TPA: hypothetical protein VJN88_12165 [Ktedonobacterales bacterium]|nr:hypothetical protein [Ktedonobacterales bacterium]